MQNRGTILVVDDNLGTLKMMVDILQAEGYEARPANSGELALKAMASHHPDLVLLDIRMPDIDGFEVCRRMKADDQTRHIPVIFLSAEADQQARVEVFGLGAVDFVSKPFQRDELLARISTHLDLWRLRQHLEEEVAQRTKEIEQRNQELRESEGRFRELLTSVTSYMYTVVMDCGLPVSTTHSPGCLTVTGFSADDFAADADLWYRMIHPEDRQAVIDVVQQVLASQSVKSIEHRIQHKDGSVRWVQTTLVPHVRFDGQLLSYDGVIIDITERKRIEEVQSFLAHTATGITAEEPFFNALAQYLAQSLDMDFVCIDRLEGDGLTARTLAIWYEGHFEHNMTYALQDTPCGEVVGKNICSFPSGVRQLFPHDQVLKELRAESYVGVTLFGHTGQPIGLIAVIGHQPLANQAKAESLLKLVSMRTAGELERQDAEKSLRESKELFKSLHDNLSVGVVLIAPDMRILTVNPRILDLFPGVDPTMNPFCYSVFNNPPRNEPCIECPVVKTFRDGGPHTVEKEVYTCGGIHVINMSSSAITDENGIVTAVIGTVEDITERKGLESQLRQAQKMEAIGTLAGGIAHDFNNILTPILGYSELVVDMLPPDSKERGLVLEIHIAAKRATELVKQILSFSRQTEHEKKPVQIHLIIKEALKLLRASIPTTIAIKQNVVDCGLVMSDPTQIHQVLMNLCTNAYHAMRENGGELSVSLSVVELAAQDYLDNLTLQPGPHVMLSVSDTGCGMSKELKERIFEPYFTTKKQGEGTGLGLSVVHGIVQNHHGHITVYSEPGQGTEFHVYLPQIKMHDKELGEESGVAAIARGSGTILVVDDEMAVGQLLRDLLLTLGYKVVLCSSSTEALETYRQDPARIDLVLTDMTMPGMNGVELIRRIRQLNPTMPVVLCSGFSEIMDEEKTKQIGVDGYIPKPIIKRQLAQTIHDIMEKKGRGGR